MGRGYEAGWTDSATVRARTDAMSSVAGKDQARRSQDIKVPVRLPGVPMVAPALAASVDADVALIRRLVVTEGGSRHVRQPRTASDSPPKPDPPHQIRLKIPAPPDLAQLGERLRALLRRRIQASDTLRRRGW